MDNQVLVEISARHVHVSKRIWKPYSAKAMN